MARWSLRNPHYLNVPGNEWMQEETDRETGRVNRKIFPVPQLLDPSNPRDCNRDGECVVCYEGKGKPGDVTFLGEPTPEMEPLDDEAKEISEALRAKWEHPIDTLPANGGMNAQEQAFMNALMKSFSQSQPAPNTSVPKEEFDTLKKQVEELLAQNKALAEKAAAPTARRA